MGYKREMGTLKMYGGPTARRVEQEKRKGRKV
jgi:hypothetical protein